MANASSKPTRTATRRQILMAVPLRKVQAITTRYSPRPTALAAACSAISGHPLAERFWPSAAGFTSCRARKGTTIALWFCAACATDLLQSCDFVCLRVAELGAHRFAHFRQRIFQHRELLAPDLL